MKRKCNTNLELITLKKIKFQAIMISKINKENSNKNEQT